MCYIYDNVAGYINHNERLVFLSILMITMSFRIMAGIDSAKTASNNFLSFCG